MRLIDISLECFGLGRGPRQHQSQQGESNPDQLLLLNPGVDTDCTTKAEIEVDIVAVHGLNGHHTKTWTDAETKYFWLQELSHADYLGNTARIFTFGYNATLVFNSSRALLGDIANKLLDELQGKRMDEEFEMRRPIIFICHSLGGIVVKKAFLNAHNNTEQYGTLKDSIYGITFMGTPHQGSDLADLAIKISRVADIVGTSFLSRKRFLSGLVNSLKKDSEILQEIAENFRHHATGEHRKLIKIVSFFETKVTPPLGKVVVIKNSAVLGLAGGIETQCALDADHQAMCRFSSSDDTNFGTVYRHIRTMAEGAARSGNTTEVKKGNQALSKRLHKVDYEAHLEEALAKKCENTAGWIPKSTTYQQWKKSPGHQILWLTGDVGSGKTVTTASLIEQLQGDCSALLAPGNRPILLYFFCDSKEKAKSDASNVLTAFLHQILARKPSYASEISKLITGADSTFPFTLGRMIKVLHRVLSKFPKIFLILDAIDECLVEKRQLLESLFGLAQHSRCLKLLVTSRPHPGPDLDPVFRAWKSPSVPIMPISLTEDRVRSDIERSISQKILGFKRIANVDDDLKKRVKDTILDQAGGMFLWASLAWEMFCSSWDYEWSFEGVERRLKSLEALGRGPTTPRSHSGAPGADNEGTLYGYYTAILASIPISDRGRAKRLFRWLVTAHAPLTLAELRIAYGLEGNHTCTVSLGRHLHAGNFSDEVKSLCSPFIKIVGANQIVKLVHQSVKEFFLGADHDDLRDFNVNLADAELHNSIACLTYLSFEDFSRIPSSSDPAYEDEGDLECTEKYPLLKYSALYWSHHTEHVQDHPLLWKAFLTWSGLELNMNLSFRIFWYSEGRGPFPVKATPMHILCYLGLDRLVEKALSVQGANMARDAVALGQVPLPWATVDVYDGVGRTPLHWAAANGHENIVRTLLRNTGDPRAAAHGSDNAGSTPMHLAVDYGHMNIVQLFLDCAGNDGERIKWLELASAGGHLELVMKIFSFGVDVNIPVGDYGSSLHAAAYEGHIEVVRWLLKNGADVNLCYGKHGTPLQAAAYEGNSDIVKLLLENGADVNAEGGVHGSPLQAAAFRDWREITRELLDRGANVNAPGGQHGNPFGAAMFSGHIEMMDLLGTSGATPTTTTLRRASKLDEATIHAMRLIEKEVKKGRLPGVEKRAEKVVEEFRKAILNGNKRTLNILFEIGFSAFKVAVRAGREGFLLFVVEKGMMILQMAAHKNYQEGLELLSTSYTKALGFVLCEGKPLLLEKLLFECVKGFKTLIEEGKDDDVRELEIVAIELLFAVVESENDSLIEIMAKVWIEAFEGFMGPKFKKDLMDLIRTFGTNWIARVRKRDTEKVILWAKTSGEALLAAVAGGQSQVMSTLSFLFTQILQEIFSKEPEDTISWLLGTARHELSLIDVAGMDRVRAERRTVLVTELLLATETGGRSEQGQDCHTTQTKLLDLSLPILEAVEAPSLLDTIEYSLRKFGSEKLDSSQNKRDLRILEGDFSRVLDAMIGRISGTGLEGALVRVRGAVRSHAESIISRRWA